MDPQVGASFIPKKPLGENGRGPGASGFFFLIGMILFIASILAAGAAFAYGALLNQQITQKSASLDKAQGAFDLPSIQDLLRIDSRMQSARAVMDKHVAPSGLFALLSDATLATVQFTSLDYVVASDGSAALTLEGQAKSFSDVALQSDSFGASKKLKDVIFSNIKVGNNGIVTFSVKATAVPNLLLYGIALSTQINSSVTAPAPTSTSTTQQ